MLNVNERLDESHEEIYGHRTIGCGATNPSRYPRIRPRLLIILKEGWSDNGEQWNWPDALAARVKELRGDGNAGDWKLLYPMAEWAHVSVMCRRPKRFGRLKKLSDIKDTNERLWRPKVADALERLAVTNVKKDYGTRTSNSREISNPSEEDRRALEADLAILKPDLVICGGIDPYKAVTGILKPYRAMEVSVSGKRGRKHFHYSYCKLGRRRIRLVQLYHPSARDQELVKMTYDALRTLKRHGFFDPRQFDQTPSDSERRARGLYDRRYARGASKRTARSSPSI